MGVQPQTFYFYYSFSYISPIIFLFIFLKLKGKFISDKGKSLVAEGKPAEMKF